MKKRLFTVFLIIPLLLAGCSTPKETLTNLSDVKLAQNQQLVTGQVKSITGNQIVLDVGTYRTAQRNIPGAAASGGSAQSSGSGSSTSGNANRGSGTTNRSSGGTGSAAGSSASTSPSFSLSTGSSGSDAYVSGTSYAGSRLGTNHSVTFTDQNGNPLNNAGTGGFGNFGNGNFGGGFGNNGGNSGNASGANSSAQPSGGGNFQPPAASGNTNGSGSTGGSTNTQANAQTSSGSGARGSGFTGGANRSFAAGANGFSASRFQSSGQTMNITIPVGTQILMTQTGTSTGTAAAAAAATASATLTTTTFGKIQANDIIEVILQSNADGTQTVLEAQIMG